MFQFGAATGPEFIPPAENRDWVGDTLAQLGARFGKSAQSDRLLADPPGGHVPKSLDGLFDLLCGVQQVVGQGDIEFTLIEGGDELPKGFKPLGNPSGSLLHSFGRDDEFALVFTPAIFRQRELLFASVAREVGRLEIHRTGGYLDPEHPEDWLAESELAAVLLGMGIWVANGAYLFENACCGGGCGIDLKSFRAGLSMPESVYALAVDGQRRGIPRRAAAKHLQPTQKVAFKKNWAHAQRDPSPALEAAPSSQALHS